MFRRLTSALALALLAGAAQALVIVQPATAAPAAPAGAPTPASAAAGLPNGVQRIDGGFADAAGKPLYTYNNDTMVGMSHCFEDCAVMWPPLKASPGAKPLGDWSLIRREDGSTQWAYKDKPLYTYSEDRLGQPARGLEAPNWKRAK
jgi:predicted lipoprotein with Yx(FWY)xxD motif